MIVTFFVLVVTINSEQALAAIYFINDNYLAKEQDLLRSSCK